ncbi:response regulator [Nodosilinea sp. LEGE 07298]|uniref:response regulator n=1 Tax=Nodosilinea sp. LEGE 07298 TaxID=2777970 RepID=UPI001881EFBB|nr:response regulator [Nodosilinea sp. LEGE 07298]MBE9108696.1 response regulator [Nodosilinea sp. LEGE 07298]
MRILLVEDDESITKVLEKGFAVEHYAVDVASDGHMGWQLVKAFDYDLIVLDVVLPKLDGIKFCQKLRDNAYQMPVLMVTALDSSSRKIAGLNAGADDYITKPFELDELLARVRVLLRRAQAPILSLLEWGDLQLDPNSQEVTYGETALNLTPKEYRLLELFLRKPSQVFSRSAIIDSLWNCGEAPGEDTVTAHIKGLRRKLTEVGAPADLIKTVYGVGYRLKPPNPSIGDLLVSPAAASGHGQPQSEPSASSTAPGADPWEHPRRQQIHTALRSLWSTVKVHHEERLTIVKRAVEALEANQLSADLHQQGHRAAHSLKGALGVFGLSTGSDLARRIEQQFSTPLPPESRAQLWSWVMALEQELSKGPPIAIATPPEARSPLPQLVIVDDKDSTELERTLAQAAQDRGLTVQTISDQAHWQVFQQQVTSSYRAPIPKTQLEGASAPLPDLSIFKCCLRQTDPATLAQISDLINPMPCLSVLVCSADGSLKNRIRAARLGQVSFLHNPEVAQIFSGGIEVRSRPAPAKVLIVDDDPQMLLALRTILEPWGTQITTLDHAPNFWHTLQSTCPDLLVLDIEMPDFNGIDLCQVVRQTPRWQQLPVVFLTAYTDAARKHAAMLAGANDIIDKSLTESDLVKRLFYQVRRQTAVISRDCLPSAIG